MKQRLGKQNKTLVSFSSILFLSFSSCLPWRWCFGQHQSSETEGLTVAAKPGADLRGRWGLGQRRREYTGRWLHTWGLSKGVTILRAREMGLLMLEKLLKIWRGTGIGCMGENSRFMDRKKERRSRAPWRNS